MCLTPKYILNPTIKKALNDGVCPKTSNFPDVGIKLLRRLSNGEVGEAVTRNNAKVFESINLNGKVVPKYIKVSCGKCYECIKQRINQLITRVNLELSKHSNFAYFLSLTYNDYNLPIKECVDEETGEFYYVQTVVKKDVQDFMKRLRITLSRSGYDAKDDLKVFYISEYGFSKTDNKRPHYHLILFFDKVPFNEFYDICVKCWDKGVVTLDKVLPERVRYMCTAHATASRLFPNPKGSDKPFSHWSKGLGLPTDKQIIKSLRQNKVYKDGSFSFPFDRYLRTKLFTEDEIKKMSKPIVEDDDFKRFRKYATRYYPNKEISDLTYKEVKFIDNQILQDAKSESANFFKRFVLKRK